ncbi:MAG: penicillin-binding protein 2 [Propionicimonas sp.]|nr:penicillin-binding protein 2 [Propionicimonas sp.]
MSRPLDRFFYGKPARAAKPDGARPKPRPARSSASHRAAATRSSTRPRQPARNAPRPWRRLPLAPTLGRLRMMLIAIAVVFSLAAGRAVQVQAVDADAVAAEAAKEITVTRNLPAFRGQITDRNGDVLAFTEATVTVIADPEMIRTNGKFDEPMTSKDEEVAATAAQRIADLMAVHLGGTSADYLPGLTLAGKRYSIVGRNVSAASYSNLSAAMSEAGLIGLHRESAPTRRYSNGQLAANILGYVNKEGKASGGLELALNATLSGTDGLEVYETSPNGKIPLGESELVPARNGQDYRLTIDAGLQWQVEQVLADRVRVAEAESGTAIVMNIKTGEVLALANFPSYDPNDYGSFDPDDLGNRALTDVYEPGSVQKVLTFAAMLDSGTIRPTDVVEVPGRIKSGNDYVEDAWSHGTEEFYARGVLAKSSNIGTIILARKMKKADLQGYLASFGLGRKTGIGLPGESAGILPGPDMPDYSRDGLAFGGSAVAVTAIQEAAAVAAVTNGGIYNQPRIIASTTLADGTVEEFPTAEPRRVISEEASKELVSMMEAMVTNNSAGTFVVPGYRTGAKTGTSQKINTKTGSRSGIVGSTIGVGPVEDPQLLAYVVIDNPKRGSFGGSVAGPAYQDILQLALSRYGVAPSKSESPKLPVAP